MLIHKRTVWKNASSYTRDYYTLDILYSIYKTMGYLENFDYSGFEHSYVHNCATLNDYFFPSFSIFYTEEYQCSDTIYQCEDTFFHRADFELCSKRFELGVYGVT